MSQLSLAQFPKFSVLDRLSFVENNIKEELIDDVWRINFVDSHSIIIDLELDMLFLNGERLLTTRKEKEYDELFVVRKNRLQKKTRIETLFSHGQVLAIDIGWDGRIFFKYWKTIRDYYSFRKAPDWVASYHHDRISKKKLIWVKDLRVPKIMRDD